jgi:hypothetical protein
MYFVQSANKNSPFPFLSVKADLVRDLKRLEVVVTVKTLKRLKPRCF